MAGKKKRAFGWAVIFRINFFARSAAGFRHGVQYNSEAEREKLVFFCWFGRTGTCSFELGWCGRAG